MPAEPGEWLGFAEADLAAAGRLIGDPDLPPRLACFHAQQAAEKAVKATLVRAGTPVPRTHDLVALVALVPDRVRSLLERIDLALLDPWAVDARYPGDIPDVTMGEAHLVIDAEQIVMIVRSVLL